MPGLLFEGRLRKDSCVERRCSSRGCSCIFARLLRWFQQGVITAVRASHLSYHPSENGGGIQDCSRIFNIIAVWMYYC
eukprot:5993613-Amphidinium_carterae.1